jgi:hypothetical protein
VETGMWHGREVVEHLSSNGGPDAQFRCVPCVQPCRCSCEEVVEHSPNGGPRRSSGGTLDQPVCTCRRSCEGCDDADTADCRLQTVDHSMKAFKEPALQCPGLDPIFQCPALRQKSQGKRHRPKEPPNY